MIPTRTSTDPNTIQIAIRPVKMIAGRIFCPKENGDKQFAYLRLKEHIELFVVFAVESLEIFAAVA